jgi:eukaryotic-like serine/threonine-protein kinase
MGSPMYMAPEQITGDSLDPRTDLYSLGCTLYAMLTGGPPFSSGGPLSIMHQHVHETPEPLRLRRADLPPEVDALVSELMAKAPDQRPPDAAAVRSRIASIIGRLTPDAGPSTVRRSAVAAAVAPSVMPPARPAVRPPTAQPPWWRRWRGPAGALALVAILLTAVGLALLAHQPRTATTADPPAASPSPTVPSVTPSVKTPASPTAPRTATRSAAPATTRPAATRTPTAPPPPTDPIVALRLAIQQQVDAGHLNADTARDLNHAVDDLARAVANDNPDDEAKKIKALRDKLTSLYNEGKLSADGYRTLNRNLDLVAAESG